MGPKYREQNNIDWHLKKIFTKAVDDYARNWSKREGCQVSALEAWLETVKHQIATEGEKLATDILDY